MTIDKYLILYQYVLKWGKMSKLLEIFGKAITVNVADLIWHWINCVKTDAIKPQYQQEFEEILDLISQMRLESAEQKLRFYLFENPACACGRMAAAAICLHKDCLPEAINELNSVYMRQPANTIGLYALGNCYERLGQEQQAIEFYQDALKFKNYLELPRKRLASLYFKNGQIDRVIKEYQQIRNESPDDINSLVLLGYLYISCGDYKNAIETFDRAILIHPDNFHMDEHDEIDAFISQGEFDAAERVLQDNIEQDSSRADMYMKLADVQTLMGNIEDATQNYERALELEPTCLEATVKLATCKMKAGLYSAACRLFTTAMEINDDIIDAYAGLATAQKLSGNEKRALETLSLASAIMPNSSLLFTQAAALQMHIISTGMADPDARSEVQIPDQSALLNAVYNELVLQAKSQPNSADAHYRLAVCLMRAGDHAGAAAQFEEALKINPQFSRARTKLAICNYDSNQQTKSLDTLTAEIIPAKQDLELYYKTAILFTNKSLFARAHENLQNFLSQNYARAESAQNISNVLQNLGLIDRASTLLECLAQTACKNSE